MVKNICRILATALIFIAVYQVFTLGYGCSSEIEYQTEKAIATHKHYADEHLSVIYERRIDSKTDFVHLQVDTTYHEIGKGAYRYEVLCKREYNLRSFDNGYAPAWPSDQSRDLSPNASGGLTPLSPPSELPEIPVATREQSGLLCFHSR